MVSTQFQRLGQTAFIFLQLSCRTTQNTQLAQVTNPGNSSAQFAADITEQRSCAAEEGFLDTGAQPTKVFHWTTSPTALNHPMDHIERTVRAAIPANKSLNWPGWMGNGLYVSSDPLASPVYGYTMIEFDIKPRLKLPLTNRNQGQDIFKKNCPGAVYGFYQSIKGSFVLDKYDGRALVIWDLGLIVPGSVKAFTMQPSSNTQNPAKDRAISNFRVHEEKYLEKMLGIKASVHGQAAEDWAIEDFKKQILRQKLEVCIKIPFSSKEDYFLAQSTIGQMVDFASYPASTSELSENLLEPSLQCLRQLKVIVAKPYSGKSIGKATATLLPEALELKTWISQEAKFWQAATAYAAKIHSIDDWSGEIL